MQRKLPVIIAWAVSFFGAIIVGYLIGQEVAWRKAVKIQGTLLQSAAVGSATFSSLIASEIIENDDAESRSRIMALLELELEGYYAERKLLESYPYQQDFGDFKMLEGEIEYLLSKLRSHEREIETTKIE